MSASRIGRLLLLLSVWISTAGAVFAQEAVTPTHRLQALQDQINYDRRRLNEATMAEEASVHQLQNLQNEISVREELGRNYRDRMRIIALQTDSLEASMQRLRDDLTSLKNQYRVRATHAYKYGRIHDVALILASESINQMIVRARYLNRFSDERKKKMQEIAQMSRQIQARRDTLDSIRVRNTEMIREADDQEINLTRLMGQRRESVAQLRTDRVAIERKLRQLQAAAAELQARIGHAVASETSTRRIEESGNPARAAAFAQRTGSFLQNKGRLAWPLLGAVAEPFGSRVSPVYGTVTDNPGILITATPGGEVRAVFDGQVLLVDAMPEFGTLITLSHGEYKTVYSNFSSVNVRQGELVKAGQVIGRAGTERSPKGASLFFAVFHDGKPVDPAVWLE